MRLEWNEIELAHLMRDPELREFAERTGRGVAALARGLAPRRTGAGAASIREEALFDETDHRWAVRVGADQLHAYLRFPDRGTRYIEPQRFLERAAGQYGERSRG